MTGIAQSTRSALENRVLELLAKGPLTTAEVMRETGCSFNVAYAVMSGLRDCGAVTFDVVKGIRRGSGRVAYVYSLRQEKSDEEFSAFPKAGGALALSNTRKS